MKKILIIMCITIIICGCGNKKNKDKEIKYTDNVEILRSVSVDRFGEKTLGEYLDLALEDQKWTEDKDYKDENGEGLITVTGIDSDTGSTMVINWLKHVYNKNTDMDKERVELTNFVSMTRDGKEQTYHEYEAYISNYSFRLDENIDM